MKQKPTLIIVFLVFSCIVTSQSYFSFSPVSIGKGSTGVIQTDIWSVAQNPSGSSKINSLSLAAGYFLPYHIQELSSQYFMAALPTKFGVFSTALNHYGFELYQENKVKLNYARILGSNLRMAFQLNWQHNYISQSGAVNQLYSGFGLQYDPNESLSFGFYISNPEKAKMSLLRESIEIPSLFTLGLGWKASEYFLVSTELEKQIGFKNIVKLGLEYNIKNAIWIRTGVLGKPINYSIGIGFKVFELKVDAGFSYHQILGISSGIGMSYLIPEKE